MSKLGLMLNEFWNWAGVPVDQWGKQDISVLDVDPLYFPGFDDLRKACIGLINTALTPEDIYAFLTCMALDSEEEHILYHCKLQGDTCFLEKIILNGISHPQHEARWQLTELLRQPVPNRNKYLAIFLLDPNPYVRKRARNVANSI